jgi:serine/threonine protein kinase/tetratricopeptide (TPR) repeat protein
VAIDAPTRAFSSASADLLASTPDDQLTTFDFAAAGPPAMGGDSPTMARTASSGPSGDTDAQTMAAVTNAPPAFTGPLREGQAFGSRYHIIRALGVGGMGAVYQAWDAELGVTVAIKVIRPEALADPEAATEIQRRFKRELLLARQVTHKNVVRIHDLGEIDGIKYITMTFVDGADLATMLKRDGRLPVPRIMHIARDVVAGLLAAHKAGVVHRDLKPANIVIEHSGDALIMDFGIARSSSRGPVAAIPAPAGLRVTGAAADATRFGAIVGTVEYMAPEQARGAEVDHRADIYAFGLMLYDMLVGREHRAQHADSAIAELQKRMEQPPPTAKSLVAEIPDPLDRLISRCLEPDPSKRYATTEELAADLDRLDENGKLIPLPRRFTSRTIAGAALLVVALIGGTWWFTRTPPPAKAHDPISIVIADFQNGTSDPTFGDVMAQTARRALEGASFISAYDRAKMGSIGVRPPPKLDDAAARAIALKQGFGIVLAGAIQQNGEGYDIAVTASQTVTGDVITSSKGHASSKDQVLPTATRLMAGIRKALGDPTSESAQLFAMRSLTASSPEAIKYYAAAVEAQAQAKVEDARQNYLKAVELDPNFGLAYQGLAVSSWNLGRPQEADKYIQQALRHLDTMTDRERFATRGYYDKLIGDNAQCVKEYGDLLARYPADATAHNGRAACFYNLRDMKSAVDELTQAVRILPNHAGFKTNLALLTALAGDYDTAQRDAQALPQNPFTLQILAYTQTGRGELAQAADTYKTIAATGPAGTSAAATGLGDLAIYDGRFSDAIHILEQGAAADLAAKNANKAAIKLTSVAYAELLGGHRAQAVAAADTALADSTSMAVRFLAGRVYAEAGALAKAQAQSASLDSELPTQPRAYGRIIEGLIALNDGKPRDAIRILNDANGMLDTWFGRFDLGRAYLAAGALPQADAEFDRAISRRGEALTLMDEGPTFGYFPPVYYYQGRVRQGLNTAGFADAFGRYLDIRGKSIEDPLVRDARTRAGK